MIRHLNKTYILGENILAKAPIFSKGCRCSLSLIEKKNIPIDMYIFGRFINKKWERISTKVDTSDRIFFEESIINGISEITNIHDVIADKSMEKISPIIYLLDDEKFKD